MIDYSKTTDCPECNQDFPNWSWQVNVINKHKKCFRCCDKAGIRLVKDLEEGGDCDQTTGQKEYWYGTESYYDYFYTQLPDYSKNELVLCPRCNGTGKVKGASKYPVPTWEERKDNTEG